MKKALIHGDKIVQVSNDEFPVAGNLFWVNCQDDCTTKWKYNKGNISSPEEISPQEQLVILKTTCEHAIMQYIQSKVDAYNDAHYLTLEDVYRCELYSRMDGYSHQAFCQAVWQWNVAVWEEARNIINLVLTNQIQITNPQQVIDRLPEFTFVI